MFDKVNWFLNDGQSVKTIQVNIIEMELKFIHRYIASVADAALNNHNLTNYNFSDIAH